MAPGYFDVTLVRASDTTFLSGTYSPGGTPIDWTGASLTIEIRNQPLTGNATEDAKSTVFSTMSTASGGAGVTLSSGGAFLAKLVNNAGAPNTSVIPKGSYWYTARVTDAAGNRGEPFLVGKVTVTGG